MRTINNTPFQLAPLSSHVAPPELSLTFVLKGTFDIKGNAPCAVAKKQRPIMGDKPHLDDIGRSPAWATDLAPFKPHTDFFVIGSFYQPGGKAAPEGRAAFELGPLQKELVFHGPRFAARGPDKAWRISEAQPMTAVPLRWEYSFGGLSDRRNPMGMGLDPIETANGVRTIPLPLIEDPRCPIQTMADHPEPANFAPVPLSFQARRRKLGTRDRRWQVFRAPLPPKDYDPSYHNAAPDDQQAGNYPRGDETLILRNLHPTIPELTTRLPGVRPRIGLVRITPTGPVAEEVHMNLDTVVAVPDENQLVLLWRGVIPVRTRMYPDELPLLECDLEPLDQPPATPDLPARVLARYLKEQSTEAEDAHTAEVMADIRKLLSKASLPPDMMKAVQTEDDPAVLHSALEDYLTKMLADLEKKYPGIGAST